MPASGGPKRFFARYAEAYARNRSQAQGSDLSRLIELASVEQGELVLDVGTGPGHTALALATRGGRVVGADRTTEMLGQARRLQLERKTAGVEWVRAVAAPLPFRDGTFGTVVSRRAVRHFPDVNAFAREAARVLRPQGELLVADMLSPEDDGGPLDELERARDPSHGHALPESEWGGMLATAGLRLTELDRQTEYLALEQWLSPVPLGGPEEQQVLGVLSRATEALKERLGVRERGGRIDGWLKRRIVLRAVRLPSSGSTGSSSAPT
jgi:SAM-dependent methyltransferase